MQNKLYLTYLHRDAELFKTKAMAEGEARRYTEKFPQYSMRVERLDPPSQANHGFWALAVLENGDFVGYVHYYQDRGL